MHGNIAKEQEKIKITWYTDIKIFLPESLKYTVFRTMRIRDIKSDAYKKGISI